MPSSMQRTPRSRCCLLHKLAVSDRSIIRPHVEDIWMSEHFRLGVVMDPIDAIKYAKDSTLAMLLAAQARNFELAHLEQSDLTLRDGVAFGRVRPLSVRADAQDWFTLGEARVEKLGDL